MNDYIQVEGVTKIYNSGRPDEVRALTGVSLTISRSEVIVLKGPSGSGKTSLLSLIGCMGRPTEGTIRFEGRTVSKLSERFLTEVRRQSFGFIFQQFHLLRDVSVLENVLLPLYPLKTGFPEMLERARGILARLGIAGKEKMRAGQLSGGEQQRVAVARALINDPQVIIADEPTAHLDSRLSAELMSVLGELHGEGRTVVIATHDPFVFEHPLVGRSVEMRDGRITGETSP